MRGLISGDMSHPGVVHPDEVVPLFSGDHESCQAGRVDGQEHHGEQCPDRGHEPGREGPGAVGVDRNLKYL